MVAKFNPISIKEIAKNSNPVGKLLSRYNTSYLEVFTTNTMHSLLLLIYYHLVIHISNRNAVSWSFVVIIGTIIFVSNYGPRFYAVYIGIEIIGAIISLCWFYRANKNVHAFGAKEVSSPRMAVIWFFVPILQLWKPYNVAQQIWKASNPEITISNGTEWKNSKSSYIIILWWIPGIISYVVPFIDDSGILGNVLFIASTVFFIVMIRQVSAWQEIVGKSI